MEDRRESGESNAKGNKENGERPRLSHRKLKGLRQVPGKKMLEDHSLGRDREWGLRVVWSLNLKLCESIT